MREKATRGHGLAIPQEKRKLLKMLLVNDQDLNLFFLITSTCSGLNLSDAENDTSLRDFNSKKTQNYFKKRR